MGIKELNKRPEIIANKKVLKVYTQLDRLLSELKKKELSNEIISAINNEIEHVNAVSDSGNTLRKQVRKSQRDVVKLLEKELKLVVKNHYRNLWLAVGMSAFGMPLGAAFGMSLDNMGLLGVGLPIGMVIGMALGTSMDKKAFKEGRQLDLELNY
tara:strand:+ start:675 stop:1139 length:465 start_codon:yes stop_codon:yes gene_type:complete